MAYSDLRKIAFVGDYLPRKCGIATFTHDLRNAVASLPRPNASSSPWTTSRAVTNILPKFASSFPSRTWIRTAGRRTS